jgi:methyl-accepting chemotaxis protein
MRGGRLPHIGTSPQPPADYADVSALRAVRVPVRAKLLGGFGVLAVLMLVLAVAGMSRTSQLGDQAVSIGEGLLPASQLIREVDKDVTNLRAHQWQYLSSTHAGERGPLEEEMASDREEVLEGLAAYEREHVADAQDRRFLDGTRRTFEAYSEAGATAIAAAKRGEALRAEELLDELQEEYDAIDEVVEPWLEHNAELAGAALAETRGDKASAKRLAIVLSALSVLTALGLGLVLSRSIGRGVGDVLHRLRMLTDHCSADLRRGIEALREGDLTHRITPVTPRIDRWSNDEVGDVAQAVNTMRDNFVATVEAFNVSMEALSSTITEVGRSAGNVATASNQMATTSEQAGRATAEIASAVSDVALGAQRQVESLEETRRLTGEVVTATTGSAEDASQTARAAQDARRVADEGEAAIVEASSAMAAVRAASSDATEAIRALGEKSSQIGSIVDTITAISEQTNLLALNAAIEAARAGEQGRGFAVVAEEVRKLAEESSAAASSIGALVRDIQGETARAVEVVEEGGRRTDSGAATVEQARAAFEAIGSSVGDVTDRVARIAAAVEQVAASSTRIAERVVDVASVAEESSASTEQVSASTEETSASTQQIAAGAQELAATAAELERLVASFRVAPAEAV